MARGPVFVLAGLVSLALSGCASLSQSLADAAAAGNAAAVQSLIKEGAGANGGRTWLCSEPLCNPRSRGGPPRLCDKLSPSFEERHPILMALPVLAAFPFCVADVLLARASGGSCDPAGDNIPLLLAARNGKDEAARALLAAGADARAAGDDGSTPLMYAAKRGDIPLIQALLAAGAGVAARNNCKTSALMLAARNGRVDAVSALLGAGASVNIQDAHGWTPLMFAAMDGSPETARLLLAAGAERETLNQGGLTALGIARQYGHDYAARLLEGSEPSSPAPGLAGSAGTPLRSAVDFPSFASPERPDDFAVVVGIENYDLFKTPALYAERDARAAARYMGALGVPANHTMTLLGPQATRGLLKSRVERWLSDNVKPDSTVYFYFSGHGAPDPKSGRAYLLPYDGDPGDLKDTAYPIERLYSVLAGLRARRVLALLDSCFSGAGGRSVIASGARPLVTVRPDSPEGGVKAMSAAGPQQVAGDMPGQGHGLFTYYLLKGLNGAAAGPAGKLSVKSLYRYLEPRVEAQAKLDFRAQAPQLLPTGWIGDWTLRAASPASAP